MNLLKAFLVMAMLACTIPARAQSDDVFAGLASDNFDMIGEAVTALALSGDRLRGYETALRALFHRVIPFK